MEKPLLITSKKKVLEQYTLLRDLDCHVAYSKKTNNTVWKVLEEYTDCEVCCHNLKETEDIKDKNRIWYFTLATKKEELEKIFSIGIKKFVVDLPDDLDTLLDYIKEKNQKIDLLLRMKVRENTVFTGKYFVFGMDSKFVNEKIKELRDNQNINMLGIHFHRKSQNVSEWSLKNEMEDALLPETLKDIDILDIGGGIPSRYKSSHDRSIERVFSKIKELREWLPENIQLLTEPGRFIAAPSTKLQCSIIAVHENNIYVNLSMYSCALDTTIANVKLLVEDELEKGKQYTIKGCTPCSMDILRYKVILADPKVGDKITFLNSGAYTYSTDFCHLDKVENIIVD